ncbi:hypothetical protein H8A99_39535 [Bradyrhizobium sp. Arg68]|uniref:hypothetical protein n=1 Tax=Bradyrhizobium ivorense TaxID=2511166 RepID=UPI001E47F333|nr:hypothetical protein [Bradyrhizobium ivorense]MCC8942342.1 hypothetical protein [Bradyrhizobium ivorense]
MSIFVFPYTCVMSVIPALIIVWLAARLKTRSLAFFACAGAVAGVLSIGAFVGLNRSSWMFAVAGLAAGAAYWFVAGRHGGRDSQLRDEPA